MVRSMLLDRDAADDVAQEVLISVMGSIGSYRGTGKVTSWLHTIVKRRVADHLRAHRESRRLRGSRVLLHRTFTSAREGFLPHDDSSHPHHRPGRWRRSRRRRGRAGHPGRRDHLDLRGRGGGGLRHRPAGSRSASQRHTRTEHLGHGTVEHRESIAVRAGGDGQVEQLPVGLRVGHVQPVLALLCPREHTLGVGCRVPDHAGHAAGGVLLGVLEPGRPCPFGGSDSSLVITRSSPRPHRRAPGRSGPPSPRARHRRPCLLPYRLSARAGPSSRGPRGWWRAGRGGRPARCPH
ncbi:MAG TPA: sigma-70 family RNA polymerase sigma factor [Candidatus Brachybacterium merdigallinarum]|nr:sigma-70 family RNA polymerase sigma factor [Candidatus Brachybacterium merdigallinarum]